MRLHPFDKDDSSGNQVVEVGVDWLTVTSKGLVGIQLLNDVAQEAVRASVGENKIEYQEFRAHGYLGWRTTTVNFGTRPDGAVCQFKGPIADTFFDELALEVYNVTRIDLQMTVYMSPYNPDYAHMQYLRVKATTPEEGQRKYTYMVDLKGSDTLNVGSRQSEQYGRIYDKYGQSKRQWEYKNCYRFEVELKGDRAKQYAKALHKLENRNEVIRDFVLAWFSERNVLVPELTPGNLSSIMAFSRDKSTVEKKLNWLRAQVAPTVQQLLLQGFDKDVWDALNVLPSKNDLAQ